MSEIRKPSRSRTHAGLLALSIASASAVAAPPDQPTFDRAAWQGDYAALKRELEQRYANLAWFASSEGGVDLPALDRYTTAALAIAGNDDEAASVLANFARSFHGGTLRHRRGFHHCGRSRG